MSPTSFLAPTEPSFVSETRSLVTEREVRERARWLARGLTRLSIKSGDLVVFAFCADHHVEKAIARNAARILDAKTMEFDAPPLSCPEGCRFVVACNDAAIEWQKRNLPGLLIADAPCCFWWRAMETRERKLETLELGA